MRFKGKNTSSRARTSSIINPGQNFDHEILVVTLPGSIKAVRKNISALLDSEIVVHGIELMKGGSRSGQGVHGASDSGYRYGNRDQGGHQHGARDTALKTTTPQQQP